MSNTEAVRESDVLWRGHPWVVPALVGGAIMAVFVAVALAWLEYMFNVAFVSIFSYPLVALTVAAVVLVWLISALQLAVVRASNLYTLRGSSLQIKRGLIGKKEFTLSAAGFSDLEVIQGITGRILNMGDIMMETDSHRDLRLMKVRDPTAVSDMLRRVMTTPMVRIAQGMPAIEDSVTKRKST